MIIPDKKDYLVPPAHRNGPYYCEEKMGDQTQRHSILPVKGAFVKPIDSLAHSNSAVIALS